jgi:hypothetical protein
MTLDDLGATAIATPDLAVDYYGARFWIGDGFAWERRILKTETTGRIALLPGTHILDARSLVAKFDSEWGMGAALVDFQHSARNIWQFWLEVVFDRRVGRIIHGALFLSTRWDARND